MGKRTTALSARTGWVLEPAPLATLALLQSERTVARSPRRLGVRVTAQHDNRPALGLEADQLLKQRTVGAVSHGIPFQGPALPRSERFACRTSHCPHSERLASI